MKIARLLLLTTVSLILQTVMARAQSSPVIGIQLEIGPVGSDQVSGSLVSGAVGTSNLLTLDRSFAIGRNNAIAASDSLAVGMYNNIYAASAGCVLTVGGSNLMSGGDSALVGYNNEMTAGTTASLLVGALNYGDNANSSIIAGYNCVAQNAEGTATFGIGLINSWNYCTVLGRYNHTGVNAGPLFVVGNGVDAVTPSNALEVYESGKVVILNRQGDIPMGEFGDPEP